MKSEASLRVDLDSYYKRVEVGSYSVRYVKVGNGPEPIFGFPGLLGSVKIGFEKLLDFFAKDAKDFTFYSWDQPGYFGSQPPVRRTEDISFEAEVELCADFLRLLGHSSYTLMGWSAGGQLSLLLGMKYPELIKRIMIWGAWDRLSGPDLDTHIWFRNLNHWEPTILKGMIEDNGRGREGYETHWHAWMDFILKNYSGEYDEVNWVKRFDRITCPTLILWGSRDHIVSLKQAETLSQLIKNARLEIIPKAPHWIQTVFPETLYETLKEFIRESVTNS